MSARSGEKLVQAPTEIEHIRFECVRCGACCRNSNLLVTLTGSDLVRLSIALNLDHKALMRAIDFYTLEPDAPVPVGLRHIPSVETENGRAFVALRKLEGGDCIFLLDNECMIHPARPDACRSFPFFFQKQNGLKWGLSAMKDICPGLGKGPEVDYRDLTELARAVTTSLVAQRTFVDEWNRGRTSHTAAEFIKRALNDPKFRL